MKRLLQLLPATSFCILLLIFTFLANTIAFAQTKQRLLVMTPYQASQNLDFFFLHSIHPLAFFELPKQSPVFLSIITPQQKAEYEQAGYKPKVIDNHAVDKSRYLIVFKEHQVRTPVTVKMTPKLRTHGVELVYQLTETRVLMRIAKGTSFGQIDSADEQFEGLRAHGFAWDMIPPVDRTSPDLPQKLAQMHSGIAQPAHKSELISTQTIGIILLLLIVGSVGFLLVKARKNIHDTEVK
jgi:hypothetical protein